MKEIKNKTDLISYITEHEISFYSKKTAPVLYHGTDISVIQMDDDKRCKLISACKTIIKYLLRVYDDNNFKNRIGDLKENTKEMYAIADAYSCAYGMQCNSPKYSYGNLYMTSQASKAASYAKRSWICGELGYMAYYLYKGCIDFCFHQPVDEEYVNAREILVNIKRNKNPCVLIYTEVSRKDLELDDGRDLTNIDKPYLYNMVRLKKGKESLFNSGVLIHEDLFDCLQEIDELIEDHFEELLIKTISQVREEFK